MDFALSETQEMLRNSAREFLDARESVALARRAHSDPSANTALWREICQLGWPGLAVDEEYGGSGLGFDDLCVLLEECAAALMPGPLFESAVLGASMISERASDPLKSTLLPQIASGDAIVTLAYLDGECRWDEPVTAYAERGADDSWRLHGVKPIVPAGDLATHFIVAAGTRPGDLRLFVVPSDSPELEVTRLSAASGEPYSSIVMHGVRVPRGMVLRGSTDGVSPVWPALAQAATARAAQMAAAADTVVRRTVGYVSSRKQFGRPIGSFQAVQHRLADMATAVRGARHLARLAAWRITNDQWEPAAIARAKSYASQHMPQVCWDAHQLHGAIGFTWEHDLHLYTRRVISWRTEYGDVRFWLQTAADELMSAERVGESG